MMDTIERKICFYESAKGTFSLPHGMAKRFRKKKPRSSEIPAKASATDTLAITPQPWLNRPWILGAILVGAVILVYTPVWYAGFIWDDDIHLTANPYIVGPLGMLDIWTSSLWQPFALVISAFRVEHALWGLAPLPYHLVNVAEQATCGVLLWQVLRNLQIPGAWLGAALWVLHPVQVESVAWISEMKNTQSGLFYLLTILCFLRWLKTKDLGRQDGLGWNYAWALLFAALAMTSKSSTMVLPIVLVLCAWWMEGRWHWRQLVWVAPLFLISVLACTVTLWPPTPDPSAMVDHRWDRTWPEKVAATGDVIWFYLGKLLWPHPLITIYPRWQIDASQWVSYLPLLAVFIAIFGLWLKRETWSRPWFFAFAYFLVVLSPFLGLIDQSFWRYSFVEDHLQYLAGMGPLALAGAGLVRIADFVIPGRLWLQSTLGAGVLLILGLLSWQRTWAYESEETLWTNTLARNPNCWMGHNNLGNILFQKGQVDEAMAQYQEALEINPNLAVAHNNLGGALFQKGNLEEAMAQFQKALEINPNYADAYKNLGNALFQKGQVNDAMTQYLKALEINPNYADVHNNLGHALFMKGQVDEALAQFQKALEIDPNYADAHNSLGIALSKKGRLDDAIAQFQDALRLKPDYTAAQNNLAKAQAIIRPASQPK